MRLFLLVLLGACAPPPAPPPPPPGSLTPTGATVATVDGQVVTQDMIDAVTRRFPEDQLAAMKADPAQYSDLIERIILGQALYKRAIDQGLDKDPALTEVFAMADREILASELLEKVSAAAVTDAAVQDYYDRHKVQYAMPSVKVHHMIVQDPAQAQSIVDQLREGGDFAALAAQYSLDGGQDGGDLGWVQKGRMLPDLEGAVFGAAKGDVVGPVHSPHGEHVLKIDDRRESTPLEDVRPEVVAKLKEDAVQAYLEQIKGEMKIEYAAAAPPDPTKAP